jgi:hypothetical protein
MSIFDRGNSDAFCIFRRVPRSATTSFEVMQKTMPSTSLRIM